ncbi:molybdopterin oxidoreductase family protein [Ketobacter sp.]|uniref:molybdopterin oxidoreductase family protein n=1 Tax=Ketobacter sp. TaxID=2083498 RepID=UPI000F1D6012|nr:molybdopterin oxidoreductase family protein [Ketobacter sp.]RLU01592.1 MAG: molybdopterin oxidoreductase family protein [Ketobacter sp.]
MSEATTHYRVCHLCEAMCGLEITTQGDQVVTIKGDADDPFSQGYVCPKSTAIADIHEDPDRIRQPMRRVGDTWQPIAWEEAFDLVATKLVEVQGQHGTNAVGIYLGNPSVHNWGMLTHGANFFKPLKTRNRFSATSVDQLPHQLMCYWMYGHQVQVPVPDIDHTDLLIIVGGNPMASNGSLWSVPGFRLRAKALQKRGGKLVVIDPRRTETAAIADQHAFIRPGTDAFLLLAMAREIFSNGWVKTGHLTPHLADLDQAEQAVATFTPELAEEKTGVKADTIRQLAYDLAHTRNAAIYGRMGISVQQFGAICQWGIQLLNIITGHLDVPGGYTFSLPAVDMVWGPMGKAGHFNAWQTRVRGLPEFGGELPSSALAEEILTPGEGQIKALVTGAGNPVLSTPNGEQLEAGLASLEFMVSIDFYINETTRFADVILPPTSPLEHDHYDLALSVFAVRNFAKYSAAVFDKPAGAMHDWEILAALGERVSRLKGLEPLPSFAPEMVLHMGLQSGPYRDQLNLQVLKDNPHGVDMGPHASQFPERLVHSDKLIRCAPEPVLEDLARLLEQTEEEDEWPFRLIGRRHVRSNNSWMHNYQRLVKGKSRCQLMMHPDDVARLGLQDGQPVRVSSRVGEVVAQLESTADVMPGVVSLPHGWGHGRQGVQARVAQAHAGVSMNDLTDDQFLDELSGNAALNGVPVAVVAA